LKNALADGLLAILRDQIEQPIFHFVNWLQAGNLLFAETDADFLSVDDVQCLGESVTASFKKLPLPSKIVHHCKQVEADLRGAAKALGAAIAEIQENKDEVVIDFNSLVALRKVLDPPCAEHMKGFGKIGDLKMHLNGRLDGKACNAAMSAAENFAMGIICILRLTDNIETLPPPAPGSLEPPPSSDPPPSQPPAPPLTKPLTMEQVKEVAELPCEKPNDHCLQIFRVIGDVAPHVFASHSIPVGPVGQQEVNVHQVSAAIFALRFVKMLVPLEANMTAVEASISELMAAWKEAEHHSLKSPANWRLSEVLTCSLQILNEKLKATISSTCDSIEASIAKVLACTADPELAKTQELVDSEDFPDGEETKAELLKIVAGDTAKAFYVEMKAFEQLHNASEVFVANLQAAVAGIPSFIRTVDIGSEVDKFKEKHADAEKAAMGHPSLLLGMATAVQAGLRNLTEKEASTIGRAGLVFKCQKGVSKKKFLNMTPKIGLWLSKLSSSKV